MPAVRNVLVAVGLAASLAGCSTSGGASGPVVKPPLQSRAPSPSPTPAAPAVPPPAALANTRDGASAFATFYIGVLSDAYQSGDTTDLKSNSDSGCEGCKNFIRAIDSGTAEGLRSDGGTFRVLVAVAPPLAADGTVIVDLRYQRDAARVFDAQGTIVATPGGGPPVDLQVRVGRESQGWTTLGVRTVDLSETAS